MSIKIALAGNPNSGKTTLFNALTGSNQYVGNWPGVTVEKKEGKLKGHKNVTITDLPGIYSLSPYTLEEVIARKYLLNEKPSAILNIVDGTNLERNLYLTTQLAELGIPVVIAVNMMDIVEKRGDKIDIRKLSQQIGCPVYAISALKGTGIKEAAEAAVAAAEENIVQKKIFTNNIEEAIEKITKFLPDNISKDQKRFYAVKIFERDKKIIEILEAGTAKNLMTKAENIITETENYLDDDAESIITNERYLYIGKIIKDSYKKNNKGALTISDKIDKVVTNRWAALPIFAVIMSLVYYVSVTTLGGVLTDWANDGLFGEEWHLFGIDAVTIPGIPVFIENALKAIGCADWLKSLILDGIVGGVGAVLGFVPQILLLFIFLAILEGCGYMARVAFIMDRIFRKLGLSGKSFIPMLVGTGCGVPGIMASRTIESDRDRKMTIMTTTFIPCGAKLPIIALIAGALFAEAWWVGPSAYFLGVASVIVSGLILKKTKMFAGDPAPFVMELPAYHIPTVGNVLRSMWERGWSFIKKAGTIILLSAIIIWFLSNFGFTNGGFGMVDDMNDGLLAAVGGAIAFLFVPLGFGKWQYVSASVMGLVAKENLVSTLGVLFEYADIAEDGAEIWGELAASLTPAGAYALLAFNLLCAPCFAAIGAIKREMNNPKWTWFAIGYQTVFAYAVALMIYQFGTFASGGGFSVGTAAAVVVLALFIYMLVRPNKYENTLNEKRNVLSVNV
ncbi:MAG: ferrous iron transport protein B [Firmicutes bacterium]|nr:ferrous iron transport protein B [Bacillota bacterium]